LRPDPAQAAAPLPATTDKRWYLLTAKPNQDVRACENLENQGYSVYRPLARVPRVVRGKRSYRFESLFPRYLFIHLDTELDNWAPIRSTYGVAGFVKFGQMPSVVPDRLIEYIRQHENAYGRRAVEITEFKADDPVLVMDGPFRGAEGLFQHFDGEGRAMVLMQFLGQQRPMRIPAGILRAI